MRRAHSSNVYMQAVWWLGVLGLMGVMCGCTACVHYSSSCVISFCSITVCILDYTWSSWHTMQNIYTCILHVHLSCTPRNRWHRFVPSRGRLQQTPCLCTGGPRHLARPQHQPCAAGGGTHSCPHGCALCIRSHSGAGHTVRNRHVVQCGQGAHKCAPNHARDGVWRGLYLAGERGGGAYRDVVQPTAARGDGRNAPVLRDDCAVFLPGVLEKQVVVKGVLLHAKQQVHTYKCTISAEFDHTINADRKCPRQITTTTFTKYHTPITCRNAIASS